MCFDSYVLSHIQLFATPWTVAHQAPLSVGFPRQEYRSGLPFPSPLIPIGENNKKPETNLVFASVLGVHQQPPVPN